MADEVDEIVAAWRRERPDLDVEPLQVLSRVTRLAAILDDRRSRAFVEHGLGGHEFDVLSVLRRSGRPFERTAGELAALTHVTSGTMTSRLDGLVGRGLVSRHSDPSDGRLVRVRLTQPGRARVDAAMESLLDGERELLAALDDRERAALSAALRTLLEASLSARRPRVVGCGQYRNRDVSRGGSHQPHRRRRAALGRIDCRRDPWRPAGQGVPPTLVFDRAVEPRRLARPARHDGARDEPRAQQLPGAELRAGRRPRRQAAPGDRARPAGRRLRRPVRPAPDDGDLGPHPVRAVPVHPARAPGRRRGPDHSPGCSSPAS